MTTPIPIVLTPEQRTMCRRMLESPTATPYLRQRALILLLAERQRRKELPGVFVLRDGRVHFQPTKFGVIGVDQNVEVLDGLKEGDEVVSGPTQALRTLKEWDRAEIDDSRTGAGAASRSR